MFQALSSASRHLIFSTKEKLPFLHKNESARGLAHSKSFTHFAALL
jgi:hypothetical protein